MLNETIKRLEKRINESSSLNDDKKAELLKLMITLREEIGVLAATRQEDSESVTHFTESSTHEVLKQEKNSQLINLSLDGLKKSVEAFETSHPKLTRAVNHFCTVLANLGI